MFTLKQDVGEGGPRRRSFFNLLNIVEDGLGFLILHQEGKLKPQMKTTEREIWAHHKEYFDHNKYLWRT